MMMKVPLSHKLTHVVAVIDEQDCAAGRSSMSALEQYGAVTKARRLARRTQSALTLIAFLPEPSFTSNLLALMSDDESPDVSLGRMREAVFSLAEEIQLVDGLAVQCHIISSEFDAKALMDWLDRVPADLLVLPKPVATLTAGALAVRYSPLIRQTALPTWFADGQNRPGDGVVAALGTRDLQSSRDSEQGLGFDVLDAAQGVSELFKADLHLVQASPLGLHEPIRGEANGQTHAREKRALNAFARANGVDSEQTVVANGAIAEVVNESADKLNAGLIVMGANNHSRWDFLFRSGAAEATLARSERDVLFVKTGAPTAPAPAAILSSAILAEEPGGVDTLDMVVDPRGHFSRPLSVLRDDVLTRNDKVLVLRGWEEELAFGGLASQPGDLKDPQPIRRELDEVHRALSRLGERPEHCRALAA